MFSGGKGANCAAAAARAGCQVKFVGPHGSDAFGKMARDRLAQEGIDISDFIELPSSKTGAALFFQERKTATYAALASTSANNQLSPALVRKVEPANRESDLVFTHFAISSSVLEEIYRICDCHKKHLVVHAEPAQSPIHFSKSAYLVVANGFEAPLLVGCDDLDSAIHELHRLGVQNVIIKQKNRSLTFSDGIKVRSQPIPSTPPIQDVGSLECLTAWAAIRTGDLANAVRLGAKAMAVSFSRHGALDSMPYPSEVDFGGPHE